MDNLRRKRKYISILLIFTLFFMQLADVFPAKIFVKAEGIEVGTKEGNTAVPENPVEDTANIRMIFTTDLHGQLTTMNYETGEITKKGSLARAAKVIEKARNEAGQENTLLFDVGDTLYDYSTDYIYDCDENAAQPIYSAMASLGYDAITLGNHDFDYDLRYIQDQLQKAGLADKCVLSNVKDANTGKNIWNQNKIIERTVHTASGTAITVKVGVIGETVPSLSAKRTSYKGVLKTEDIVKNAQNEATALKAQGADIIVALAHSGIGSEEPAENAENASYALTKIPEIDVVLCGHLHKYFPSDLAASEEYYELSGVDAQTGLANGKNLIMIAEQGKAVGIADLTIQQENGVVSIVDRKSDIKMVTEDTEIDENINNNFMGNWQRDLVSNCSTILGEIASGIVYHNYFATLEDTAVIQLVNNAKIDYALKYINSDNTDYKNYHVIAASNYTKYGLDDQYDYVDFSGNFLQSYLSGIQRYRTALYIYKLTGKQLREWVELSASAYQTQVNVATNSAVNVTTITEQNILEKEWVTNWSNFFVFDGVEYVIDTTVAPRYNRQGEKISDSFRVKQLTVNGVNVNDSDTFILSSNKLPADIGLMKEISSQKVTTSKERCQIIVKNYIEENAMNGTLKNIQDNNWKVEFPENRRYVVQSGTNSEEIVKKESWFKGVLYEKDGYKYYLADFSKVDKKDITGPNIVATELNSAITNKDVVVAIEANDASGITSLKYALGKYPANSSVWQYAENVLNNRFTCSENGTYTILAEDTLGNKNVYYIRINNINKSVLQAPVVKTYTNRKTKITGTAEAGAKIYFELENGKTYTSTVTEKGTFSYKLPTQEAGKTVYVYVVDKKGRASARTVVTVKRTGPNKPAVNTVNSNSKIIKGNLNDSYVSVVALVDESTIYVSDDSGMEIYKNTELYDENYKIVEVPIKIDSKGTYSMQLPSLIEGETSVEIYTIDSLSRVSLGCNTTVVQRVPNKPQLGNDSITNLTKKVTIYTDEKCSVHVKVLDKVYSSNKAAYVESKNVYSYTVTIPKTNSGVEVKIYASNIAGNSASLTVKKKESAPNTPTLNKIKAGSKTITGKVHLIYNGDGEATVSNSKTKVYIKIKKKTYTAKIKNDGTFKVKVPKLKKGTTISYWAENANGTGIKGKRKVS